MDKTILIIFLVIVPLLVSLVISFLGLSKASYRIAFKRRKKRKLEKKFQPTSSDGRITRRILKRRPSHELYLRSLEPEPKLEAVFLGASAPRVVRPGEEFTARFVCYIARFEREVKLQLFRLSPRAESHMGVKNCRWHPGTKVKVRLQGKHILFASAEEEFTWEGDSNLIEFDAAVLADCLDTVTVLKFDVMIDEIIIAKLRLDLDISSKPTVGSMRSVWTEPAHSAFASYASADRLRVLDRVSEIQKNGVEVFLDCLSLHPGEEWKPRLEKEIIHRELFLLFWSTSAKQSEYVTWEWRTALKHKGLSGIDPHPLDPVFDAEPPDELKGLHFGDPHMLVRKAYEQSS